MGYSFQDHVNASPGQTDFTFGFVGRDGEEYLRPADIEVYVDGVEVTFELTGPGSLTLDTPTTGGELVRIRRVMPEIEPYSDFSTGNSFSYENVNYTNLQQLYLLHELYDGFLPDDHYFKQPVNFGGYQIKGISPGTESGDAVTVDQVLDASLIPPRKHKEVLTSAVSYIEIDFLISASLDSFILFADGVVQYDAEPCDSSGVPVSSGTTNYVTLGSELPAGTSIMVVG